MKIRVRDLPDLFKTPSPRPLLLCRVCGEECSAHKGDYFAAHPDTVMAHCGEPMDLVLKQTVYRKAHR